MISAEWRGSGMLAINSLAGGPRGTVGMGYDNSGPMRPLF